MYKRLIIILTGLLLLMTGCGEDSPVQDTNPDKQNSAFERDLKEIKERGKLVAITGYNAYSYFIYRGQPMGFEYELVTRLAEELGVDLEFKIVRNLNQMFESLNNGEGDLIAFNLTVTSERKEMVSFTHHHHTTRQILVQRRPENWRRMRMDQIEDALIRNPIRLEGKTITVRNGSAYKTRLENMEEEMGIDMNVVEADPDLSTEDLIRMVAEGEIEFTVSDENIAMLNQAYYDNVDINTQVSLPHRIAWAVRKNSPELLKGINDWIEKMRKTPDYFVIYRKYFKNSREFRTRLASQFFSQKGGKISRYDELLKKYSEKLDWDWRIIASLIYQESQFDPEARSWAGAVGLMQLMPATASQYGVKDLTDPHQNLEAGIKYLVWLDNYWKKMIDNKNERIKFVLASYNIGLGHILDARNLAEKYGGNPNVWFDQVEKFLLMKSDAKFYNDEVVKYGFARGTETVKYVAEVLNRFRQYKQFIS